MLPYDPDYVRHEPQTYELATVSKRFFASFIDGIILIFTVGIISVVLFDENLAIDVLGQFIYYWYFWTQWDGQTLGKRIMHIRIIKADGSPINGIDVLVRYLGYTVSGLFLGLGYFWALFDANNQAWHDKMAGTYVVVASSPRKRKMIGDADVQPPENMV
jgi:uncharacterized RDD family membrane protein YckC